MSDLTPEQIASALKIVRETIEPLNDPAEWGTPVTDVITQLQAQVAGKGYETQITSLQTVIKDLQAQVAALEARLNNLDEKCAALVKFMRKNQIEAVLAVITELAFLYPSESDDE